ncbi:MAG: hypothetical protein E6K13_00080 [Methanobacteriota archaeon]|nr:MAG: hypothetical protein E6K13_00080 [Euryarchaeota archaeon]
MGIDIESGLPLRGRDLGACAHPDLLYLGEGGNAMYYRCRTCGAGVIEQRGRLWVLRENPK